MIFKNILCLLLALAKADAFGKDLWPNMFLYNLWLRRYCFTTFVPNRRVNTFHILICVCLLNFATSVNRIHVFVLPSISSLIFIFLRTTFGLDLTHYLLTLLSFLLISWIIARYCGDLLFKSFWVLFRVTLLSSA